MQKCMRNLLVNRDSANADRYAQDGMGQGTGGSHGSAGSTSYIDAWNDGSSYRNGTTVDLTMAILTFCGKVNNCQAALRVFDEASL